MIVGERVLTPSGEGEIVHEEKIGGWARGALIVRDRWWYTVRLDSGEQHIYAAENVRPLRDER